MLARSLELSDAPFDAINREQEKTSFMLTFENLSRPLEIDEEDFLDQIQNNLFP